MRFIALLFLAVLFSSSSLKADAGTKEQGIVMLKADEIYEGDYFAVGSSVEISGLVKGDAYILGTQVIIDGTVNGDVIVTAGSVEISGDVLGNVRVLAGQVTISGTVGRNVTAFAANVQLTGDVKGNIVSAAGNADLAGDLGGTAKLAVSNLRLSSKVGKDVAAYVGEMRVTSNATIGGNLDYRSNAPARIDPHAKIMGMTIYQPSIFYSVSEWPWLKGVVIGSKIAGLLMNFLYTFVLGWILIRMFPTKLERTLEILQDKPLQALGYGIVILVVLPLVCLLLLMTVIGAPFAFTLIALNIIGFYTAKIFSILWASNWLFSKIGMKHNSLSTLAAGQGLYTILTTVPIFGSLLALAAMLLGLGAIVMGQGNKKSAFLPRPN